MWDPEVEKKKREQAMDRIRIPPLAGKNSAPPEVIPIENVLSDEDTLRKYESPKVGKALRIPEEAREFLKKCKGQVPEVPIRDREPGEEG